MINILARVALYQEKFCINLFHFLIFFFFCVTRKHFRSSLKLEFSSSSSSCAHTNVLTVRTTHQSALMRWHMCDFYKIIRKCHLLSKKHSRFIQSLPVQFIEETQKIFFIRFLLPSRAHKLNHHHHLQQHTHMTSIYREK